MIFLFSTVKENADKNAVLICAFVQPHLYKIGEKSADKYGFICLDICCFNEKQGRENPYYAFNQYPQYDEIANNGGIEFRTHPSDIGHQMIAEEFLKVIVPSIKEKMHKEKIDETTTVNDVDTCKIENKSVINPKQCCWDFVNKNTGGLTFGGFNMRFADDLVMINTGPNSSVAVYTDKLDLSSGFTGFSFYAIVSSNQKDVKLVVTIKNGDVSKETCLDATVGKLTKYVVPISKEFSHITGFRIEPQILNCNLGIKKIEFKK